MIETPLYSDQVRQICTFRVAELLCGLEVSDVQEIVRYHEMTPVPLAPHGVVGLLNLRGEVVTAVDLRRQLGLPPRSEEVLATNVVVRTDHGVLSLLVDDIGDIVDVPEHLAEAPPPTMDARTRDFVQRVYKLEGELLLVLSRGRVNALEIPQDSYTAGPRGADLSGEN